MMDPTVFMIDQGNQLTELSRADYDSEALFQSLLGDHPAVLGQVGGTSGRLLLVRREAPVPESEDSSGRWSLDHLFLDREGVPVLVEVKRATDTRARREVVAQMLDYAANGVAYWPIEQISEAFSATARARGEDPGLTLAEFLGETDADAYWRAVEANLRSGRVRMVFVADRIPKELRRIVEFLNEQMRPAEVLAIEVEQFIGTRGLRLLTPRVVGATERAASNKAVSQPRPALSEQEWLSSLAELKGRVAGDQAQALLEWFRAEGFTVGMTGSRDAMFARLLRPDGKPTWPFFIRRSTGKVETSLQYLKDNPVFASDEARLTLLSRIKALPRQTINTTKATGWPALPLEDFASADLWEGFTAMALDVKARNAQG